MREGEIGTFDSCTSTWSIVGSEASVEKKRGRAGRLNTLQVSPIGFIKYCIPNILSDDKSLKVPNSTP